MRNYYAFRKLALCFILCLTAASAMAVPAMHIQQRIRLADGSEITATLCGDERVSYYEASNGTLYFKQADGICRPTSPLELQLRFNDRMTSEKVREQMFLAANPKATARRHAPRRGVSLVSPYIGKKKGLVILVEFTDKKFADSNPQPFYNDMFNKEGFTEDGQAGSVHDYFYDQSYGQFNLTFDVVGPITLTQSMSYYGGKNGDASDNYEHIAEMVSEACTKVDGQVDFSQYDWDGDGYADQVYIIYAGFGEATGGGDDTIWPHQSGIQNGPTLDNTTIRTYACSNELMGVDYRMGIGTAVHEFSHCLGLPDFYNTNNGAGGGPGDWDIMAGGNYNGNGHCPVGYSSYERWVCGWMAPIVLEESQEITDMPALENEPIAYMLPHDTNEDEYFLLENRQPVKWDKRTGGKGLLIFHVDYDATIWAYNTVNNDHTHERMKLMAADGNAATYPANDTYPGANGLYVNFTDTSTPSNSILYNPTPDGAYKLGKPIENITEKDGKISFSALNGTFPRPQVTATNEINATGFTLAWDAVAGAESYMISLESQRNPYKTPEEGEMLREDFKGCFAAVADVTNDISDNMNSYTTVPGWSGEYLYRSPQGLQLGNTYTGRLQSPVQPQSINGDISILVSFKAVGTSKANCKLYIYTKKGYYMWWNITNGNGWFYLHTSDNWMSGMGDYYIAISGSSVFAIDNIVVMDGVYDNQAINDYLNTLAPAAAPQQVQRVSTPNIVGNIKTAAVAPQLAQQKSTIYATTTDTKYTITGLDNNYTYYVRVAAIGSDGKVRWSDKTEVILSDYTVGDANDDGLIDITDVTAIQYYIHHGLSDGFNVKAADANNDGVVDITDITTLIYWIHNGNNKAKALNMAPQRVVIEDIWE